MRNNEGAPCSPDCSDQSPTRLLISPSFVSSFFPCYSSLQMQSKHHRQEGRWNRRASDTSAPWTTPKLGLPLFLWGKFFKKKKNKTLRVGGKHSHGNLYQLGVTFSWKHLSGGFLYWPCGFSPHWYYYLIGGWQKNCLNLLISLERASWGSC